MKNDFITFASFLWSDPARRRNYKFTTQHPIILRNMLKRQCSIPHEVVIITDSREAAETLSKENIRCIPQDMRTHVDGTCLRKLMIHRPDIGGMLGRRIVALDLDVVIVSNVDSLFDREEDAVFFRNPNFEPGNRRAFFQGSVQMITAGARSQLYTDFNPEVTPSWINRRFGGAEQAYISELLPWNEAYWDQSHGVYGLGRLFDGKPDDGIQSELPENAKLIVVPGDRLPDQSDVQEKHPWIREFYF
jgi:hypothetical protein